MSSVIIYLYFFFHVENSYWYCKPSLLAVHDAFVEFFFFFFGLIYESEVRVSNCVCLWLTGV